LIEIDFQAFFSSLTENIFEAWRVERGL